MDSILEDYRKVRASEQRNEVHFRLNELIAAGGTLRRQAAGLRIRMERCDISADGRGFIIEELQQVRTAIIDALGIIQEVEALCPATPVVKLLEAAE